MPKFRPRVLTVEAVQWDGSDLNAVAEFFDDGRTIVLHLDGRLRVSVPGHGYLMVRCGDWLVGKSDVFVCPDNVFPHVYEPAGAPLSKPSKP